MLRKFHTSLIVVLSVLLGIKAFFEFNTNFDYLMYHLPLALDYFSLTTYIPNDFLAQRKMSFPPLANLIQGLLVYLSGRTSFANSINVIGVGIAVITIKKICRNNFSVRWFLTAILAVPYLCIHLYSGYIDLWSSAFVLIAFVALEVMSKDNWRSIGLVFIAAILISMLSKLTVWLTCWIIAAAFILKLFGCAKGIRPCVYVLLLFGALLVWPIHNLIIYGNPVYPFPPPFKTLEPTLKNKWRTDYHYAMATSHKYLNWSRPMRFFFSVFELNRMFISKRPFQWSYDQGGPNSSPHYRMGGWTPLFPLLGLIALGWVIREKFRERCRIHAGTSPWFVLAKHYDDLIVPLAFLVCVVSSMLYCGSHDLRYSFYIPLFFAYQIALIAPKKLIPIKVGTLVGVVWVFASIHPFLIDLRSPEAHAPKAAREFWSSANTQSRENPNSINVKVDRGIFYAGPTFNSFWVKNEGWGESPDNRPATEDEDTQEIDERGEVQ